MVEWAAPVHRFVDERGTDCTARKAYPACDAARTIYFRYAKSDDSLGRCRPIGIVRLILVVFPAVTFLAAYARTYMPGLCRVLPCRAIFHWLDSLPRRCRAVAGANDASAASGKPLGERMDPMLPRAWAAAMGAIIGRAAF